MGEAGKGLAKAGTEAVSSGLITKVVKIPVADLAMRSFPSARSTAIGRLVYPLFADEMGEGVSKA